MDDYKLKIRDLNSLYENETKDYDYWEKAKWLAYVAGHLALKVSPETLKEAVTNANKMILEERNVRPN